MKTGKLYLIPSFLAESDYTQVFPQKNIVIINTLEEFIVEDIRTARRFLRKLGYNRSFDDVRFNILDKHTDVTNYYEFISNLFTGINIGILSEAGMPCVADPGAEIVKLAHRNNFEVVPLIGPSSILLALAGSGFNGQNFIFHGYLPIDSKEKQKRIKELERNANRYKQTQIFIETPYRNNKMVQAIVHNCQPETMLCVAVNLTAEDELISSRSVADWKKSLPDLHKKPAVFLISA